jgi:hypothetical protein
MRFIALFLLVLVPVALCISAPVPAPKGEKIAAPKLSFLSRVVRTYDCSYEGDGVGPGGINPPVVRETTIVLKAVNGGGEEVQMQHDATLTLKVHADKLSDFKVGQTVRLFIAPVPEEK